MSGCPRWTWPRQSSTTWPPRSKDAARPTSRTRCSWRATCITCGIPAVTSGRAAGIWTGRLSCSRPASAPSSSWASAGRCPTPSTRWAASPRPAASLPRRCGGSPRHRPCALRPEPRRNSYLAQRCTLAEGKARAAQAGTGPPPGITAREFQVARLVAGGLTNRQIGRRLAISERTAERHVENLRRKLGVGTRAQVAAWVSALPTPS